MIRGSFISSSERLELESCVRSHRKYHGVARRVNAILLLDDGKSCCLIAEFLYLDDDTICGWYKAYRQDGWKGSQSRMTSTQEVELCERIDGRFFRSTVEIRAHIRKKLGLEYSHSGCIRAFPRFIEAKFPASPCGRTGFWPHFCFNVSWKRFKLLARLGFEFRKPNDLPRLAFVEKPVEFIEMYERLLNELGADEAVYFADAVLPQHQTKPAYGWVKVDSNPAVSTSAERGRVNIHGALNLETFEAPFVAPASVDGASSAQLLAKIEARNPNRSLIYVIWDNAPYHKGAEVREFLARPDCRIRLFPLPPYCPHLNPIERLWAVIYQLVTHNRHYPTQKQFAHAILRFFRETLPKERKTFQSQVSDNLRIISHENFWVM